MKRGSFLALVVVIAIGAFLTAQRAGDGDRPGDRPAQPVSRPGPAGAAEQPASGVIGIGSWNIEWLGKPSDRSGAAKGVAQSPDDIADYIIGSGVAVLAVEEIVAPGPGRPIRSREIEAAVAAIKQKHGAAWDYVLFPGRADGDQLTGVLWNTGVVTAINAAGKPWSQTADSAWALPIPRGRSAQGSALWNRPPHAMKFRAGEGKTDFVVIVLHMKADYNGDFAAHRAEEAGALAAALPAVRSRFGDQDIVLIGDTNCSKQGEPAIATLERAGLMDLNAAGAPTHWQGGSMDRALVPAAQPEFASRAFSVYSDAYLSLRNLTPRDYKRRFSDHYLITAAIAVMPDDD